jgi:hypothetical protein
LAPSTATALQAPTAGNTGAAYPPNPVAAEEQHFIWAGPGHLPDTEVPAQSLAHRQFPALVLAHEALVQHLTSPASAGHPPLMVMPPEDVHLLVERQTPGQRE